MREHNPRGRPREFDEDEALAKVMDVFWAQGFEGTSLTDLTAATGLKRGSLYAAYGDKRAMYIRALAHYDRTAIDAAVRALTGTGSAETRIGAFLQSAVDAVVVHGDRRGCFLCNASIDQAALNPQAERSVRAGLGRLGRALEAALSELTATSIKERRQTAAAQHLLSVYFGLRVLARGGQPVAALRDAKAVAIRSLNPSHG